MNTFENGHHIHHDEYIDLNCLTETANSIAALSLSIHLSSETSMVNQNMTHVGGKKASEDGDLLPHHTQPHKMMKDLNKEERMRLIREKNEQELAKKKRELEENLKRKQDLWYKQQKERQRRIDELKLKENEKRIACEERRKKREQDDRVCSIQCFKLISFYFMFYLSCVFKMRLNEFLKKEQERTKLASKSNMKGSEWMLSPASSSLATTHPNNAEIGGGDDLNQTINKSQSAYNLNQKKLVNFQNTTRDIILL